MTAGSDAFADAPLLSTRQNRTVHAVGSSAGATTEGGEPLRAGTIDRTRWLKFVPAVDGRLAYVQLTGTTGPGRWVTLYSGDGTIGGLVELNALFSDGEFWVPFDDLLEAGQPYWLQIGTEVGAADSDYELVLTFEQRIRVESDWIQGPDFVRDVGSINFDRVLEQTNRYGVNATEGVAGGFDYSPWSAAMHEALTRDEDGPSEAGVPLHLSLMNATHGYFEEADESNYYAWSQAVAWYFSAFYLREPPPTDITDDQYSAIEWEGDGLCTPIGGDLVAPILNASHDGSTDPLSPVGDGSWDTKITAVTGVSWDTPDDMSETERDSVITHDLASSAGLDLDSYGPGRDTDPDLVTNTYDVSDALEEYGRLTVMLYLDPATLTAPTTELLTPNFTDLSFGALAIDPYVEMLMHPPRHRFYGYQWLPYLEEPLRRFGRGGNLALGSGRVVGNGTAAETLHVVGGAP